MGVRGLSLGLEKLERLRVPACPQGRARAGSPAAWRARTRSNTGSQARSLESRRALHRRSALQRFAQTEGFQIAELFVEVESGKHDADKRPVLAKAPTGRSRHCAALNGQPRPSKRRALTGSSENRTLFSISTGPSLFETKMDTGPLLMLWTAPPPARECHGCGAC
jgi:hypothetical protein